MASESVLPRSVSPVAEPSSPKRSPENSILAALSLLAFIACFAAAAFILAAPAQPEHVASSWRPLTPLRITGGPFAWYKKVVWSAGNGGIQFSTSSESLDEKLDDLQVQQSQPRGKDTWEFSTSTENLDDELLNGDDGELPHSVPRVHAATEALSGRVQPDLTSVSQSDEHLEGRATEQVMEFSDWSIVEGSTGEGFEPEQAAGSQGGSLKQPADIRNFISRWRSAAHKKEQSPRQEAVGIDAPSDA